MPIVVEQLQQMMDADFGSAMDTTLAPSCGCAIC